MTEQVSETHDVRRGMSDLSEMFLVTVGKFVQDRKR